MNTPARSVRAVVQALDVVWIERRRFFDQRAAVAKSIREARQVGATWPEIADALGGVAITTARRIMESDTPDPTQPPLPMPERMTEELDR